MNKRIFLGLLLLSTTSLFARDSWRPPSALSEPSLEMAPLPSELFEEPMNLPRKNPLKVFYYGKADLFIDHHFAAGIPFVGVSLRKQLNPFSAIETDVSLFSLFGIVSLSVAQVSVCPLIYISNNNNMYLRAGVGSLFTMCSFQPFYVMPVTPFSVGYQTPTKFIDAGVDIIYDSLHDVAFVPTLRFGTTF